MKIKGLLFAVFLGIILPWILLMGTEKKILAEVTEETNATESKQESLMIEVKRADGSLEEMDLEEYILGVVLGEMPSDFETDALKAQAVVARTFAVKNTLSDYKHIDCDVCVDSNCCQNYFDPALYCKEGGSEEDLKRFRSAVEETAGQVLVYGGQLIEATYFSCSGGRTEDAVAVWGTEVPYLKALDSPGEEHAEHYMDTVNYSASEFESKIGEDLPGLPGTWVKKVSYTQGGGVDTIQIGSKSYGGTEIRKKLGLRSTAFVISVVGDTVTITTKGFGHRVGMSQYGADAMAAQGSDYDQILDYYYPGTNLTTYTDV